MKIKPSITQSICSGIKSKIAPGLQGFGVVLFISQASFAVAETIDEKYVVSSTRTSYAKVIDVLPEDGKLSGSLTVTNGTEDDYLGFSTIYGLSINDRSDTLALENFALSITNYGVDGGASYMDTYAISGGMLSLKKVDIDITTHGGKGSTFLYGINNATLVDFDSESTLDLTSSASGATQVYGISAAIQNFAGKVTVKSASEAVALTINNPQEYGTQFASTTVVSATGTEYVMALEYYLDATTPASSYATFDGKFTAESTGGGDGDSASAAYISAYGNGNVNSIKGTYTTTAGLNAQALVLDGNIYTKTIDAKLIMTANGELYSSDAVAYVGHVGAIEGGARVTGFDDFSGTITAKGAANAVGMELQHVYDADNSSGTISGSISAQTDDTYFLTRDEYGDAVGNWENFDRSTYHFKSTAAIRVVGVYANGEEGGGGDEPEVSRAALPLQVTELNFAHGARAEALVGAEGSTKSYGDAIQFTTDQLVLNAAPNATVTLIGDITTDAEAYSGGGGSGGGLESVTGDATTATTSTTRRILTYNEGTYNVSSDYWFVSQVELGNSETSATGHVRLLDSTRFVATDTLNFHVNSATDYSNITVSAAEILTVSELGDVNVTLGADLMHTENFEINLIAGNMLDTAGNELFITLTDLVIGDGTAEGSLGDDLASIYVIYNGEKTFYTEGMSIVMDGNSKNLTIGRGMIPEPSTATLSLLALAGLIARRRRQGA